MRPDHSSYTGDFILIDSIAYSPSTASPSTALGKLAKKIRASNRIGCRWLCATLFAVFCLASANVSHAEDRFALLIGNAEYVEGSRLTNPERDVDALASTLGKLGFQVSAVKNVDQEGFDDALNDFERRLTSGSIAVFFYAGHGFQVDGENYLLPLRHGIESKREVRRKCISVSEIVGMLEESRCNLRIVVLDACRNNPFERSWSRSDSVEGFTAVVPPDGTIIAFATAPGEVASDGRDGNSPFTKSLIKTFDSASKNPIEIQRLFRLVGQECSREANQRPYINADASMKDYLLGAIGSENQTPQPKSSPTGAPSSPPESPPTPLAESNNIAPTMVTSLPKSPEMPSAKQTTPNPDRGPRLGVLCIASLSGPIVVSVAPESPAASCRFVSNPATTYALSVGDQIKKINGIDVSDGAEFTRAVTRGDSDDCQTSQRPDPGTDDAAERPETVEENRQLSHSRWNCKVDPNANRTGDRRVVTARRSENHWRDLEFGCIKNTSRKSARHGTNKGRDC